LDNLISNGLHQLPEASIITVTSKGKNHFLYFIKSPSFHISVDAIQLAQLNRMIK